MPTLSYFTDPVNSSLPACPSDNKPLNDIIAYPSVTFTYIFLALISLLFGSITAFRYNSVPVNVVKERQGKISKTETVRKSSVSNTLWVLYFFSLCLRTSFDAVRFALYRETEEVLDDALAFGSLFLLGVSVLTLTLSLEHQRLHRSKFKKKDEGLINSRPEPEAEDETSKKLRKAFVLLRAPLALLFLYFVGIGAFFVESSAYFWVFIVFYILQRLPLIILSGFIIFNRNEDENEGPSIMSRIILFVAIVLDLVHEIPITIWSFIVFELSPAHLRAHPCVVGGALSIVDFIHFLFALSQILLFIFLREEFIRNKEPCVWSIVSKRHEGYFDFREFEDEDASIDTTRPAEYDQLFKTAKFADF